MIRLLLICFGTVCAAFAHYTWIAPVALWEVGKPAALQIGHGHRFPLSEEAINARQVDLFVVSPSGARTKLTAAPAGPAVTSTFTPKEQGPHRIAFVQDRGVTSRTPRGVKPGGRDQNPDAKSASRTLRTAVSYVGTNGAAPVAGKPLGLEIELCAELVNGAWNLLALKQGKPMSGVGIEVFLAGAEKALDAGKTDGNGKLRYQPPAGAKGPAVFTLELKEPAPAGSNYDTANYETSLYVNW
ncbi:MAG: DUF4198 domain-containing protein [Bryobacterales bacterium]|nr:DUF4198 domain-containing protein [Bryobacterales bacterium]